MTFLTDILNRYIGGNSGSAGTQTEDDFHHVAQNVPSDVLSKGITAALGSSQTPPAGELVSQMFNASTPEQRAALLNQLATALGPNGASILSGVLGQTGVVAGSAPSITPQQASTVTPQQ